MNGVTIDLSILRHNIEIIDGWMAQHGATWTLVTKACCGHADTLRGLQQLGVRSMGDSRLENLIAIERIVPELEAWYLRPPHISALKEVVALSDVSLNSELDIIDALNEEAERRSKIHRIIVMIELGDLREGLLPSSLIASYHHVFKLPHIDVLGIGANLGCLTGTVPSIDQLAQLSLYRELLELKFDRKLPMISAGSSAVLPLLFRNQVPRAINHFRIGEAVFLGTDLINGGTLAGLRSDAITLEAEIVEIKEKGLVPLGETTAMTPFEAVAPSGVTGDHELEPGRRGFRAIVALGQLDTEVGGLTPLNRQYQIAGASSDLTVINLDDNPDGLKVGDSIRFRPNYAALVRLMSGRYVTKNVVPSRDSFAAQLDQEPLELRAEQSLA